MYVHAPVHSIHIVACCILLLLFPTLPPGLAEGYLEFHCSLFAVIEYVGGHGEGRASVVTSCQSAEPNLLNAAFALVGFVVHSAPRTFSAGLLVNTEDQKNVQ